MTGLSEDARFFLSTHQMMRGLVRNKLEKLSAPLVSSYKSALSVVASQAKRSDGKYAELNEKAMRRGPILAAFTVGLSLVEDAIFGGYPIQAAALVRQELEAIAALVEIEANTRRDKVTPNIRGLNVHGRIYGTLSQITHLADNEWVRRLIAYEEPPNLGGLPANATEAWSISPRYSESLFSTLGIHVFLVLHFTEQQALHMKDLHDLDETPEEVAYAEASLKILADEGVVEIVDQPIIPGDRQLAAAP
jgi:hypothetical protein